MLTVLSSANCFEDESLCSSATKIFWGCRLSCRKISFCTTQTNRFSDPCCAVLFEGKICLDQMDIGLSALSWANTKHSNLTISNWSSGGGGGCGGGCDNWICRQTPQKLVIIECQETFSPARKKMNRIILASCCNWHALSLKLMKLAKFFQQKLWPQKAIKIKSQSVTCFTKVKHRCRIPGDTDGTIKISPLALF